MQGEREQRPVPKPRQKHVIGRRGAGFRSWNPLIDLTRSLCLATLSFLRQSLFFLPSLLFIEGQALELLIQLIP